MTLLDVERSAKPRYRTVPASRSSAGREAVELAASAGLVMDAWQAAVLEDALGERDDQKWAALSVGLIVPRQNGKGAILEARELAGLYLFGERLILHSAHEFKTAAEAYRRIRGLIESTPDLDRRVHKMLANNNDMSIELRGGQRLRFVARSGGSGRGFTGDCVILDEAYNLDNRIMSALYPTLSARPNPQVWYTSSAPLPEEKSDVLRRFCRRGRAGTPNVAYIEYCAEADDDPESLETVVKANPAFAIRMNAEFIDSERPVLGEDFARERLGIWPDLLEGAGVIDPEVWNACLDEKSGPVDPVAFALDVSPDRKWASFGVAGPSALGGTHVELVERRHGTDWVVERAAELQDRWGGQLAVAIGSPAASLLGELVQAGISVLEVSPGDHAQACGLLFDAVTQGEIKHLGDSALTVAVNGAQQKFSADAWLWSRRSSAVDISPLVAVTLAFWGLRNRPAVVEPFFATG